MKSLIYFLVITIQMNLSAAAVTYNFSGGRFGDNVLAYLHAKWISHCYDIPLLYKPFPYSSELKMDLLEAKFANAKKLPEVEITRYYPDRIQKDAPVLYLCPYFPESKWELSRQHSYFIYPVDWQDPRFRKIALEMIAPEKDLALITPPSDTFNIAMHIRQAGNFDDFDHFFKHPTKTPPVSYYSECLRGVIQRLPLGQKVYCHIFTDDADPASIVNTIRQSVPDQIPVSFGYRSENNKHDANVLEDFYSLFNFDALIRSESNYSIVPSLLHDYSIVTYPVAFTIENRIVTITQVDFQVYKGRLQKCLAKKRS